MSELLKMKATYMPMFLQTPGKDGAPGKGMQVAVLEKQPGGEFMFELHMRDENGETKILFDDVQDIGNFVVENLKNVMVEIKDE